MYSLLRGLLIELPIKLAQLVTHLTCIRKVPSLISGRDTDYFEDFHGFPQSLRADNRLENTSTTHGLFGGGGAHFRLKPYINIGSPFSSSKTAKMSFAWPWWYIPEQYSTLGHGRFLSPSCQLIIHCHPVIRHYINCVVGSIVKQTTNKY
jgi:hypothetical protein